MTGAVSVAVLVGAVLVSALVSAAITFVVTLALCVEEATREIRSERIRVRLVTLHRVRAHLPAHVIREELERELPGILP